MNIDLTYRTTLENTFERLFDKQTQLQKSRPISAASLRNLKESLSLEWTYNSNSIEGNTLSLRETQMVLQEGITIKGKSLREHFEAKNHENALFLLEKLVSTKTSLSLNVILDLHALILRSIEDDQAGRIRNAGVRISGANFIPPNARKVTFLLEELISFVNSNPLNLNIIELATIFHHQFVWIHPFFDGNGRTARLSMNLILMSFGFPPAIILRNDRKKYYSALNAANNGNYQKLMLLVAQALERTLNIYINALPGVDYGYDEISNIVEEDDVPYGQEYVSLLARQGKIDAYKEGKNWLTSKEAILNYIHNRKRAR
ncbi:MAG: Fic family protein [Flavobacteriales bacterium]|nr:Fic family protein [Flavobacteriales bacterium]